jgi:diguanylate cyclase (GGDEF)-like protein
MLDARTLFFLMIVASLVLALSLWIGAGTRNRQGLFKWVISLLLQTVAFALFAMRGYISDGWTVLAANSVLLVCMTLKADAIFEFYGRRISLWWHLGPAVMLATFFTLLLQQPTTRVLLGSMVYAVAQLTLALIVHRMQEGQRRSPASWLMIFGFLIGSIAFFTRAAAAVVAPHWVSDLLNASTFQAVNFVVGFAVFLVTSVGFLLLFKERAEDEAQRLAATDPLTDTFNRRTFLELGAKELARSKRTHQPMSLVMLDLDHFKKINDKHGHLAGDDVLRRFVDIAQVCLRKEDLLVRYGGEEFCVLLPDETSQGAYTMAERIRYAVEHAAFRHGRVLLPITVSAGVAELDHNADETLAELLARADEALYAAKNTGRNRVVRYPENSTLAVLMKTRLEQ